MKPKPKKLIALVLIVSFISLPMSVLAQERRGANLKVTRKDGMQVNGELIGVKPHALLLLSHVGKDESVDIVDISSITITRKSNAGSGFLVGFLIGAVAGGVIAYKTNPDETYRGIGTAAGAVLLGCLAGLLGLAVGAAAGSDETMYLEGMSEDAVRDTLAKLRDKARIRSVE